jgi:hypothetical protein
MATDRRVQATSQVFDHVGRAREALKEFYDGGARVQGVLANPSLRAASLKWAQEEIRKAIAIIDRTKWH